MNPETTGSDGYFGWDVVPGYYEVEATLSGCSAVAETPVLSVPRHGPT
jgi:hypothetical protein